MKPKRKGVSSLRASFAFSAGKWAVCACLLMAGSWMGGPSASAHPEHSFCGNATPVFTVGNGSSLELSFDVQAGELELYRAVLTLPSGFGFNGFTAMGGANAAIGMQTITVGGIPVAEAPLRIFNEDIAYVDVNDSGERHYLEPTISHTGGGGSPHVFTLTAYFGGDGDPATHHVLVGATVKLALDTGILTEPSGAGPHLLSGTFASVDPDNDGADNGEGLSPMTCSFSANFTGFNEPPLAFRQVAIDIKPGSFPNCFNNDGKGVIPVAILGGATFDVTEVDASTLKLDSLEVAIRGKDKVMCHREDVNGDDLMDLVCLIEDTDGVFEQGTGQSTLTGQTTGGESFSGRDSICVTQ